MNVEDLLGLQVAGSVLPLLVALFNVVIATEVLSSRGRSALALALGPAGVAIFGVGWFVSLLHPVAVAPTATVAAFALLLSHAGFLADALGWLKPDARRRALQVLPFVLGGVLLAAALVPSENRAVEIGRALALTCVGLTAAIAWRSVGRGDFGVDRLARRTLTAIAWCLLGIVLATAVSALAIGRVRLLPLTWMALIAEALVLVQILERRIRVRLLLSRAFVYVLVSAGGGLAIAAGLMWAGLLVELAPVALAVLIATLLGALLIGFGERLTQGLETILFPEHARVARELATTRGEVAALQRRLQRNERLALAGQIAASVAHGIKNPLAALRGYAELLEGIRPQVDDEARPRFDKAVRIIREESDRIDTRVASLLDSTRAQRGDRPVGTLLLHDAIDDALALTDVEPGKHRLTVSLDDRVSRVHGDADELRGALVNLLRNAIEAQGDDGGEIRVATRRDGDEVRVDVTDQGVGLDKAQAGHLVEAFVTTKADGTGLGLAIARSATEAAGGSLSLAPGPEGRGAVATMTLLADRTGDDDVE